MNIEEAKAEIQELVDMYGSRHDREDLDIIYNFIKKQKAELEKKDKVINEMAKWMAGGNKYIYATVEDVKEQFYNEVEREGK